MNERLTQRQMERLMEDDPVAWLRDKAERWAAIDIRNRGARKAVLRVCALAAELAEAKHALAEARPFMRHRLSCTIHDEGSSAECTCGLAAALASGGDTE